MVSEPVELSEPVEPGVQVFQSIDPARNRYRFYTLTVQPTLWETWVLTRTWGRIGSRRPRSLAKEYLTQAETAAEAARITRLRLRHGYQAVNTTGPAHSG